jgi:enamine deaminase RidA (YjgF/YER057c/UK114 family)
LPHGCFDRTIGRRIGVDTVVVIKDLPEKYSPTRRQSPPEGHAVVSVLESKIKAMGYALPEPFKFPNPNRTGCVVVGTIIYASGHGRDLAGPGVKAKGKVGGDVTVEEGYATARAVALSMLASLKHELGDLDRVKRVIRLYGMVNVAPGFDRMPQVIDGASDFFYALFGPQAGQHARTAVGMAELPHGIPVEINGEFELKA